MHRRIKKSHPFGPSLMRFVGNEERKRLGGDQIFSGDAINRRNTVAKIHLSAPYHITSLEFPSAKRHLFHHRASPAGSAICAPCLMRPTVAGSDLHSGGSRVDPRLPISRRAMVSAMVPRRPSLLCPNVAGLARDYVAGSFLPSERTHSLGTRSDLRVESSRAVQSSGRTGRRTPPSKGDACR